MFNNSLRITDFLEIIWKKKSNDLYNTVRTDKQMTWCQAKAVCVQTLRWDLKLVAASSGKAHGLVRTSADINFFRVGLVPDLKETAIPILVKSRLIDEAKRNFDFRLPSVTLLFAIDPRPPLWNRKRPSSDLCRTERIWCCCFKQNREGKQTSWAMALRQKLSDAAEVKRRLLLEEREAGNRM